MLEVSEASVVYGNSTVLHPLSLTFSTGQLTVIAGPNGAGKSTLMKLLTGEMRPTRGTVRLDDVALTEFKPHELANRRAVLPQTSRLAFPFTVFEVVRLGFSAAPIGRSRREAIATDMLEYVGLGQQAQRFYHQLSGGEQQRVQLARVLSQLVSGSAEEGSRYLLLDEPTSNLDIKHQLQALDIAKNYAKGKTGVVAVLHDLNIASAYADRLIVFCGGRCLADGAPAVTITDELMHRAFDVPLKVNSLPENADPFILPQTAIQ